MTLKISAIRGLGAACAAAGVLAIGTGVASADAGEGVQTPLTMAVHAAPLVGPPVSPGPPADPHRAQRPPTQPGPPANGIQPGPPGDGGAGFYAHCREAVQPGPPPNQRAKPGQYSPFDRDQDGKSCES